MNRVKFILKNPPGFDVDPDLLQSFEAGLDPRYPEQSHVPARVLGYGEISTVFAIEADSMKGLAFKRLPIFESSQEITDYCAIYERYISLLEDIAGIRTSPQGYAYFVSPDGRPVFYIIQQVWPAASVGHRVITSMDAPDAQQFFREVLRVLSRLWLINQEQENIQLAIDGQTSNWVVDGDAAVGGFELVYLDTSTPLFRVENVEQLNPELFLRSAPSFLRWVFRLFFLDDVVNRYYDFRLVTIDAIANMFKEQRPDLIRGLVRTANEFFSGEVSQLGIEPITEKEVEAYYKEDAFIWALYLTLRRFDRFLQTRVFRRGYPYILPGKIKR